MLVRMWNKNSHSLLGKCKKVQPFWKMVWQFLTKLNTLLTYNPAVALFGIYSN